MKEHEYGLAVITPLDPESAEVRIREALAAEGFGVLTEIDVAATLEAKLGLEWPPYKILGACNPPLAHRALQAERDVGLLLPCNVVIYAEDGHSIVAALDPRTMVALTRNQSLEPVAEEARARLVRALSALEDPTG